MKFEINKCQKELLQALMVVACIVAYVVAWVYKCLEVLNIGQTGALLCFFAINSVLAFIYLDLKCNKTTSSS